ncbi:hypothetical protein COLO4_02910 [Corchorus olitorius]|uniref:Leucine-rich repeat-containing N-terminal plant-type domain-containing protein n=1 Tax=Corchorus olitorius TaxID=93759 RepID=A0A1R3L027_9ROSI|nr:hypothetical protein COLO4_02910 [Corchorus olitorius]
MASWRRATLQILVLIFLLLLTKSIFLEAAVSKSNSGNIGRCIEKERKALLEFKTSLNDPSGYLSSWVGQDCCNWTFVSCNNKTGNVLRLDLAWLNLCISTPPNKSCGELGGLAKTNGLRSVQKQSVRRRSKLSLFVAFPQLFETERQQSHWRALYNIAKLLRVVLY